MDSVCVQEIHQFLRKSGVKQVSELDRAIEATFGYRRGGEIIDEMCVLFDRQEARLLNRKRDPFMLRDPDMVSMVNRNQILSLLCSGFYDYHVFEKVMTLICRYETYFGPKVLDVGCGNGIIDCFLAERFGGLSVTGTDMVPEARAVAGQMAQTLQVSVRFVPPEQVEKQAFNTVLSVRVLHENVFPFLSGPFPDNENLCRTEFGQYARQLSTYMVPGGILFSFERITGEHFWQIMQDEYGRAGLQIVPGTDEVAVCETGDETASYQFALWRLMTGNE